MSISKKNKVIEHRQHHFLFYIQIYAQSHYLLHRLVGYLEQVLYIYGYAYVYVCSIHTKYIHGCSPKTTDYCIRPIRVALCQFSRAAEATARLLESV